MRTLLDVIKSSRWQKALFTTYTLSLSFFESIILRSLRQGGCQQTWIIADVHGYKSSLIERKSSAVGQDYRLIPVRLSGGVFHPKCTYLVGENEDVLVVGSGNLTFGGFGRNLEVIEVFSSRKDPAIFADFSEFVLALENRGADQFQCADRLWMELFRERAQAAGRGAASVNSPKLVHSVTSPVIGTISSMVNDVDDLTVMSPFIDPDAASIHVLAKRIACKRINVAVAPKSTESNFPFELAKGWGLPVQAVWSDGEERKRPLHAKWFEFRTVDGSAVLTGSANATWQALCTTNNVEVSVFRRADGPEPWTQWIPSDIPANFVPNRHKDAAGGGLVAHATLNTAGHLSGCILGGGFESGKWECSLTKPNGAVANFDTQVDETGKFTATSAGFADFAFSSGTQIQLQRNNITARGWVHVEDILRMARLPRLNLPAFLRIIAREETEEDDAALLEYLAINANAHLPTFARKIAAVSHSTDHNEQTIVVDLEELAPRDTPQSQPGENPQTLLATLSLDRVFAQIRRRLLGHGAPPHNPVPAMISETGANESDSSDADKKPPTNANFQKSSADGLTLFDHQMHELVKAPELSPEKRRGLLVMWFEVTLSMLLTRRGDIPGAWTFLHEWVCIVARELRVGNTTDSAEQHFVTSIAALACHAAPDGSVSEFHELLEAYYQGAVNSERALSALLDPVGVPFGVVCDGLTRDVLINGIQQVLASKTVREHVAALVERLRREGAIDPLSPVFEGIVGQEIATELTHQGMRARIKEQIDERALCPTCFKFLPERAASHLIQYRIGRCEGCGSFIARTKR